MNDVLKSGIASGRAQGVRGSRRHMRVAVVGTGFSGLGMGIKLLRAGIDDFLIFERAGDVGGVWRENSYPGCACDVEAHLYSFSFAPNPYWSQLFAPRTEIWAYLQGLAHDFNLLPHVRFHHSVMEARWDAVDQCWFLQTSQGEFSADFLVGAMGGLSEPSIPNFSGQSEFEGESFHSARWNHEYDLRDKRVAVIGTGASSLQFVPEIQPQVESLRLFQRTAAWVLPRPDKEFTPELQRLFAAVPAVRRLLRAFIYAKREVFVLAFQRPAVMRRMQRLALRYLEAQIPDSELREKLTPKFILGCKRILLSGNFYRALRQPNVTLYTDPIVRLTPGGLQTRDGQMHEVDVIIYGTGFRVTDPIVSHHIRGRDGRTLADIWQGTPQAHWGTMVHGFPNLFLMTGPNTGLGHTSIILMIEAQLELIIGAISAVSRRRVAAVEPRAAAQKNWVDSVYRASEGTVWTVGGCSSWYLDDNGRNSTLWPDFTFRFRRGARFRPQEYEFERTHTGREEPWRAPAQARSFGLRHMFR